jgi:hypothetical protein
LVLRSRNVTGAYTSVEKIDITTSGTRRSVDSLEKVLDRLATSEKTTIVVERAPGGKMRVTSGSWGRREGDLRDQVPDVPNVNNRLHIARKPRKPDESDPPIEPS